MFAPNYTIEEKRVLVDEWIESSINRAEFCRMKGINTSTFDGWLNRFYPEREKKTCERSSGVVKIQSAAQERELVMEYVGNEEEAETERFIFSEFLRGCSISNIARSLTERGIPTAQGKTQWSITAVKSMLMAEMYTGSITMQKTFVDDFLSKKHIANEGQLPMYHIDDNHPAIISHDIFAAAQDEMIRRAYKGIRKKSADIFASRIVCGHCGEFLGRKTWHSTDQYAKRIWQCNSKYKSRKDRKKHSPNLSEEEIKEAARRGINQVLADRDRLIRRMENRLASSLEIDRLAKERDKQNRIMNEMALKANEILSWNSNTDAPANPEYTKAKSAFENAEKELKSAEAQILKLRAQRASYRMMLNALQEHEEQLESFSEELWLSLVDRMVVCSKEDIRLILKDGSTITL